MYQMYVFVCFLWFLFFCKSVGANGFSWEDRGRKAENTSVWTVSPGICPAGLSN